MIYVPYDDEESTYDVSFRDEQTSQRKSLTLGTRLTPTGLARRSAAARHSRTGGAIVEGAHSRRQKRSYT